MKTSSSFVARRGGSAARSARTRVRARYSHRPPRVNHAETVPRPGSSARSTRAGSAFPSATLAQERDPRLPCTGAETAPPPPRTAVSGHVPSWLLLIRLFQLSPEGTEGRATAVL